jgi:hypothetical protein
MQNAIMVIENGSGKWKQPLLTSMFRCIVGVNVSDICLVSLFKDVDY